MKEGILNYLRNGLGETLEHNRLHPECILDKNKRLNIVTLRRNGHGKVDTEGNGENEGKGNNW